MKKTETNELVVVKVDADGATVAVNGENRRISWHDLRQAASQDDAGLRAAYRGVLRQAEEMASHGPLGVSVERDETNVWWVVRVRAIHGGGEARFRRMADEGGTHGARASAASEARDIVARLGSRVQSMRGF
jgi:hypothetical protein